MARSALDDNPEMMREAAVGLSVLGVLFVVVCALTA